MVYRNWKQPKNKINIIKNHIKSQREIKKIKMK